MKKKITLAVVGYGYWGPNLVRNFLECPDCRVKYICDLSVEQLKNVLTRYPSIKTTTSYDDVLNDRSVDAVVLATPISTHYRLAKRAILHGKHVFVEKPLAATSEQGEQLVGLAEKRSLTLMVGHTFVYSPPVVKTKEIIASGDLGRIYYISSSRVNLGLHQKDASVIWDLAPHDFSIIFYWLDEEPIQIAAFGRGCIKPDVPDVAFVNMKFASGTVAEMQLSWLSPMKLRRTVVVGSKKMLVYDDTAVSERVKVFDHGVKFTDPKSFGEFQLSYRTGDVVAPNLDNQEPLYLEANHFLDCIAKGLEPRSSGRCGLRVVRAIELAEESLQDSSRFVEQRNSVFVSGSGNHEFGAQSVHGA